jgi:diacylglycerol kinase family enzyme
MPKQALLVYNPVARTAAEPDMWLGKIIHKLCEKSEYIVTVFTTHPDTTHEDLIPLIKPPIELVIAAGGDGTVRFVLATLAQASLSVPAGIVPLGTGNILARNLGIFQESLLSDPVEHAIDIIIGGKPLAIDLGIMNGQYFAVAAGAGPISDAIVIPGREEKTNWKMLAYAGSVIQTFALPPVVFRVTTDQETFKIAASGIFVTNVAEMGLGKLAQTALLNDGLLDLCILNPTVFKDYVDLGFQFVGGASAGQASYYSRQVEAVTIECVPVRSPLSTIQWLGMKVRKWVSGDPRNLPPRHKEVMAMIDGDAAGTTPMTVRVAPQAVRVLTPPLRTVS